MKKRVLQTILLTLVLALIAIPFAACNSTPAPSAPSSASATASESAPSESQAAPADTGGTTVTFWNGFTASDGDILREIFDRFNKENDKNITVQMDIMPWGNMLEKLAPALATNTAPTLILLGADTIPEYVDSGGLVPMDDFWDVSGLDRSNYAQNVQDTFLFHGKAYGIPMQYNTNYLYWNKDLFAAAGLDPESPPKTITEFQDYAAKLTDASKQQYGFGVASSGSSLSTNITNFLWSKGGDWLNPEQTKAICNSPEMIDVLTMLQNFGTNGQSPVGMTAADLDNLLLSGQLAMHINGPWLINGCRTNGINFGIGAVPASDSGNLQVPGGGVAFMITGSAGETEKLAAYECIKYWLSKDILKEWTIRNGFPPFSNDVMADADVQDDEIQKQIGPLSKYGRMPFSGMPQVGQMNSDAIDPLFEQLMYGKITPTDCAKQMEDAINMILG